MTELLVLYYSRYGAVRQMAQFVARGAASGLPITDAERKLCMALGRRLATIAVKLKS